MRCRPRIPSGAPILSDAWGCSERWGPKRHRPRSSRSKGPICQAAAGAPATVTDRAGTPARGDKKPRPGHQRGGLRRECPAGAPSAHLRTHRGLTDQGGSALPVHPATAGRTSGGCHSGRTARVLGGPGSLWSPGVQPRLAHSPCPLTVLGSASERPPATPGGASSQAGSSLTATFSRRRTHLHQPKQQPHPQALTIKLVSAHASYERLHFQEALPEQPHVKGAPATNAGRARSVSGRAPLPRPKLRFAISLAVPSTSPSRAGRPEGIPGGFLKGCGARSPRLLNGRNHCSRARRPAGGGGSTGPGPWCALTAVCQRCCDRPRNTDDRRRPQANAQSANHWVPRGTRPARTATHTATGNAPPAPPPTPLPAPPPGTRRARGGGPGRLTNFPLAPPGTAHSASSRDAGRSCPLPLCPPGAPQPQAPGSRGQAGLPPALTAH